MAVFCEAFEGMARRNEMVLMKASQEVDFSMANLSNGLILSEFSW